MAQLGPSQHLGTGLHGRKWELVIDLCFLLYYIHIEIVWKNKNIQFKPCVQKKHKTDGQASNLNAHVHKATSNAFTAKTSELNLFWKKKKFWL